jgi:hypothetical protein
MGVLLFEYLDRIYYYDGFIPDWVQQNQSVIHFGKRTTVDGIPGLPYEIRALGDATDEYTLVPLSVDLQTLYAGGFPYSEHYLRLSGTLGYDPFLDLFTLSDSGKTVYIRETMQEGSGGGFFSMVGVGIPRQDSATCWGNPSTCKCCYRAGLVRNEFTFCLDFAGCE